MNANVRNIIKWIDGMAHEQGGTVVVKATGERLDLGQALCYDAYGPDWNDIVNQNDDRDERKMLESARLWTENGSPDWVGEVR